MHLLPPIRREVWWASHGMLKGRTVTVKLCFCFVLDSQCNSLLQGPKKLHCSQIVQENAAKSDEGKRREKGRCSTSWDHLSLSPSSQRPLNPTLQFTTHVRLEQLAFFFFKWLFPPCSRVSPLTKEPDPGAPSTVWSRCHITVNLTLLSQVTFPGYWASVPDGDSQRHLMGQLLKCGRSL